MDLFTSLLEICNLETVVGFWFMRLSEESSWSLLGSCEAYLYMLASHLVPCLEPTILHGSVRSLSSHSNCWSDDHSHCDCPHRRIVESPCLKWSRWPNRSWTPVQFPVPSPSYPLKSKECTASPASERWKQLSSSWIFPSRPQWSCDLQGPVGWRWQWIPWIWGRNEWKRSVPWCRKQWRGWICRSSLRELKILKGRNRQGMRQGMRQGALRPLSLRCWAWSVARAFRKLRKPFKQCHGLQSPRSVWTCCPNLRGCWCRTICLPAKPMLLPGSSKKPFNPWGLKPRWRRHRQQAKRLRSPLHQRHHGCPLPLRSWGWNVALVFRRRKKQWELLQTLWMWMSLVGRFTQSFSLVPMLLLISP